MKNLLLPWTGFGMLCVLAGACSENPVEGVAFPPGGGTTQATSWGASSDDPSAPPQTQEGMDGEASSQANPTTTSGGPGASLDDDTGVPGEDSSGGDDEGPDPHRVCDGAALPNVVLTPFIENLENPIAAEFLPQDPGHVYVALRGGRLLRIDLDDPSEGREELFDLDVSTDGECGFLSFAFHPNYDGSSERRFYVSHTSQCAGSNSVISEYVLSGGAITQVRDIVAVSQPASNHNGGHVAFGPDGHLYFGLGDGGGSNDQYRHGQNPTTPLAAILRFDVDDPDTPPAGNLTSDMLGGAEVDERIFHWGLRNPWRFSFDRATGDLYIGDVGQGAWEEIDFLPAGAPSANFGWPAFEGQVECPSCGGATLHAASTHTKPIHVYENPEGEGDGRSITGGVVYRGSRIPNLYGRYLYGEYIEGWIAALTWDGNDGSCDHGELVTRLRQGIVSFAEDDDGEVYVVHISDGTLYRLDPA